MHNFRAKNGTAFTFDAGIVGAVTIRSGGEVIEVDGQDLIEFITRCYMAPQLISLLENAAPLEILRLLVPRLKGGVKEDLSRFDRCHFCSHARDLHNARGCGGVNYGVGDVQDPCYCPGFELPGALDEEE